jgi:hypothetical protein
MLRLLLVGSIFVLLAAAPRPALAQEAAERAPPPGSSTPQADAHYTRDVGAGLTLGGIALTGLGAGLMFGISGFENWGGVIAGGLFEGLGGLAALIGIPTWIAGGVRSDVLSHPEAERESVGWSYELAGIVTTLAGIGLCLVGGAISAIGIGLDSTWPRDERALELMRGLGVYAFIPFGYFLATFIGAPLWAEGARF